MREEARVDESVDRRRNAQLAHRDQRFEIGFDAVCEQGGLRCDDLLSDVELIGGFSDLPRGPGVFRKNSNDLSAIGVRGAKVVAAVRL